MMTTYKDVSLQTKHVSKEDLEYLVDASLALLASKQLSLEEDQSLKAAVDCLKEARATYGQSQEQDQPKDSQRLSDLDRQRDLDYADLKLYLKSQLRHRQPNRQEAAKQLFDLLEVYKEVLTKPQAEQSAGMKALLKQLEERDNRNRLTLVGAMDFYNQLKSSQERFDAAYLKRLEGRSQRPLVSKDEARRHLLKTYRMLYRYLICLEFFGKSTSHQALLAVFNDVRLTFNDTQARKHGHSKKKAKDKLPLAGLLEEPGKQISS